MYQLVLNGFADTEDFAVRMLGWMMTVLKSKGLSIALEGELGSGKTTFVAAVAKALKSNDAVSSPSYILQQEYRAADGISIEHWDLYRLPADSAPEELFEAVPVNQIRLVEWASRAQQLKKTFDLELVFSIESEESRRCKLHILNEELKASCANLNLNFEK